MNQSILPSPREIMEMQRQCQAEWRPYFELMVQERAMDPRIALLMQLDGTFLVLEPEPTSVMLQLREQVKAIQDKYQQRIAQRQKLL